MISSWQKLLDAICTSWVAEIELTQFWMHFGPAGNAAASLDAICTSWVAEIELTQLEMHFGPAGNVAASYTS